MVDLINLGDSFWLPEGTNLIAGRQESSNNLSQDKNSTEKGRFLFCHQLNIQQCFTIRGRRVIGQ